MKQQARYRPRALSSGFEADFEGRISHAIPDALKVARSSGYACDKVQGVDHERWPPWGQNLPEQRQGGVGPMNDDEPRRKVGANIFGDRFEKPRSVCGSTAGPAVVRLVDPCDWIADLAVEHRDDG